jgi:uncharacterized coiled-coil protein SlyX
MKRRFVLALFRRRYYAFDMATEFTLDLLGPIILESRDELRLMNERMSAMNERMTALERVVTNQKDEVTVLGAMVMRYTSEPVAWHAMQNELRRLRERIDALEARP